MRRRCGKLSLLAMLLLVGRAADAASLPYLGIFELELFELPVAAKVFFGVAGVGGSYPALTSVALPGAALDLAFHVPISTVPLNRLVFDFENATASFVSGAGGLGGPMALRGVVRVCYFSPACTTAQDVPLTVSGTRGVGLGGVFYSPGLVNFTIEGGPWTAGTATAYAWWYREPITRMGFVHGPLSNSASSAAQDGGVISLVTPITIHTNQGVDGAPASFARITLYFLPEPSTLTLLGTGVLLLAARGVRLQRRGGPR